MTGDVLDGSAQTINRHSIVEIGRHSFWSFEFIAVLSERLCLGYWAVC